jgi:hypothetical protein
MPYKDKNSLAAKESSKRRNKLWYEKNKNRIVEINIPEEKRCSACKVIKVSDDFYYRKNRPDGLTSWCKQCLKKHAEKYKERSKATRRKREFGITDKEYNNLYNKQSGVCAICGREESEIQQKSLCVDHCHNTGKIRGLLCHSCNVGLGRFEDDINRLQSAIKYLSI